MNAETLEALKASIEKWKRNAVAETPDAYLVRWRDCPLCLLFYEDDCNGCPIRDAGHYSCNGSPYDKASIAQAGWKYRPRAESRKTAAHEAARAEVSFLESLLPKEA